MARGDEAGDEAGPDDLDEHSRLLGALPGAVLRVARDGRIVYANRAALALLAPTADTVVGASLRSLVAPLDRDHLTEILASSGDAERSVVARLDRQDGRGPWVLVTATAIGADEGDACTVIDVGGIVAERDRADRLESVVDRLDDLVGIADGDGQVLFVNRAARAWLAAGDLDPGRVTLADLYAPEAFETYYRDTRPALLRGESWTGEMPMLGRDGEVVVAHQTIVGGTDAGGEVAWVATVGRLVDRPPASRVDTVSGLGDRRALVAALAAALDRGEGAGAPVGVVVVDLDRLGTLNAALGLAAGDQALAEAGGRLGAALGPDHLVARLDGGRFAALRAGIGSDDELAALAEHVLAGLTSTPFSLGDATWAMTASVGATLAVEAVHPEAVLRDADAAVQRAKQRGRGRVELFDATLRRRARRRDELAHQLAVGISHGQMVVLYQPVVGLRTGRVTGVEAEAHWRHPERGLLPPREFLPLAEETGLAVPLGLRVLREAARHARRWERNRLPLTVHVGLSVRLLADASLAGHVHDLLDETGLTPERISLEFAEPALLAHPARAEHALGRLRELGVRLGIDGFGTGSAALDRLPGLPLDRLKLDPVLLERLTPGASVAVLAAMVGLAHSLGFLAVAEGVRHPNQVAGLRALEVDAAQGPVFSTARRPGVVAELAGRRFPA